MPSPITMFSRRGSDNHAGRNPPFLWDHHVSPRRTTFDGPMEIIGNVRNRQSVFGNGSKELTKLLVNVTVQRSLGPVQVVTSSEKTVEGLIEAALQMYVKEKRRPFLTETDPRLFELHYSQFSFESLNREEKLMSLGSRNFFLCLRSPSSSLSSSCSKHSSSESPLTWTRFMDFLL